MEPAGAIQLSVQNLAIAAALLLISGIISLILKLRLEKRLLIAAIRTIVQLMLVGYVLKWVFSQSSLVAVLAMALVMIIAASRAAVQRSDRRFAGASLLAFVSLIFSGLITTLIVTSLVIGVDPWYRPRYLIPLLGMVLGNGLTGISLCLDTLLAALSEKRELVEMELALGATKWEAAQGPLRDATRRGMIPIINSMTVVGVVSLPGMMTGQILAGADPLHAVKYQIVIMFMIAAATSLGCIAMGLLVYRRLFNQRHQLRADKIRSST